MSNETNCCNTNDKDACTIVNQYYCGCCKGGGNGDNTAGVIFWWPHEEAPDGSLYCDGSAVSRDEYARLFDVVGTRFGEGDGATTFNLPDMRGEFVRGYDPENVRDPQGGRGIGTHQNATEHMEIASSKTVNQMVFPREEGSVSALYRDSLTTPLTTQIRMTGTTETVSGTMRYTSRPTNINLLPCIWY